MDFHEGSVICPQNLWTKTPERIRGKGGFHGSRGRGDYKSSPPQLLELRRIGELVGDALQHSDLG